MRYPDWPIRLNEYINSLHGKEWDMGTWDCCVFAAGAVEAMTGVDHMPEFRGHYDSWPSSDQALEEIGQGDLYRTIRAKFGPPVIGVKGQKGDLAFMDGSLGLVLGRTGMFLGEGGFRIVSLTQIQKAFRVT